MSAKSRKVRWVPTSGISSRAASEGAGQRADGADGVEAAGRRGRRPRPGRPSGARRTARRCRAAAPGTAISTPTPSSEPTNRPPESSSKACTDRRRNGLLTNGTSASSRGCDQHPARQALASSGCGRPAARRSRSRSTARPARSRSCWPTRSCWPRTRAPAAGRRRSPRRGWPCRRRTRRPRAGSGGGCARSEPTGAGMTATVGARPVVAVSARAGAGRSGTSRSGAAGRAGRGRPSGCRCRSGRQRPRRP